MGGPGNGVGCVWSSGRGSLIGPGSSCISDAPAATGAGGFFKGWPYKLDENLERAVQCARELSRRDFVPEISVVRTFFTAGAKVIAKGRFVDVVNNCPFEWIGETKRIDEHLEEIDRFIPTFGGMHAIDDLNKLYELRREFLRQKANICKTPIAQPSLPRLPQQNDIGGRNLAEELQQIAAKINLPLKFNDLLLVLQDWQRSKDFPKGDGNLDLFIQEVESVNKTIQQFSPKEKAEKGPLLIKQFAQERGLFFSMILRNRHAPLEVRPIAIVILGTTISVR